jgi:pyruvate kinase
MRKTKIVCTIGPSSHSPIVLEKMIEAGMDAARLDFSHGDRDGHARMIDLIRMLSDKLNRPIALLQDLQGPMIRTGPLKEVPTMLEAGAEFIITGEEILGDATMVSTTYKALAGTVRPGNAILLKDGSIRLEVIRVEGGQVVCSVLEGGLLDDHCGMNLPGLPLEVPAMTPKDEADLEFGLKNRVDYVAVSSVRTADDILGVRQKMQSVGREIPVIAKLVKPQVMDNLKEIIRASDGLMIARGDLGMEMPLECVPVIQKQIIAEAAEGKIPVITATQMLESMVDNARPTRAEASDVANAIFDGSDAVMLSEETALGNHPVEAVEMLRRIIETAEAHPSIDKALGDPKPKCPVPYPDALSDAAAHIAEEVGAKAIVIITRTGRTARYLSKYRPRVPVYAYTPSEEVYARLPLYWGIIPQRIRKAPTTTELIHEVHREIANGRTFARGDTILILSSSPDEVKKDWENVLKLHRIE